MCVPGSASPSVGPVGSWGRLVRRNVTFEWSDVEAKAMLLFVAPMVVLYVYHFVTISVRVVKRFVELV